MPKSKTRRKKLVNKPKKKAWDACSKYNKEYHKTHRREILARKKRYYEDHKHDPSYQERVRKNSLNYYYKHKQACIKAMHNWHKSLIESVINAYGGKCACCGETELLFLTIDHIDEKGANHRNQLGGRHAGRKIYQWLKARDYPDGFQVLCYNCNCGKARNNNVCPHKKGKSNESTAI